MDLCDIMLLACGVDNDALETVMDTILFIEEDNESEHSIQNEED
jgi:hypothetical protein